VKSSRRGTGDKAANGSRRVSDKKQKRVEVLEREKGERAESERGGRKGARKTSREEPVGGG